ATGNTLWIAQQLQKSFGGEIKYIPTYQGNGSEYYKIFIATPIYSFGMPKHVYEFLPKLDKTKEIYVVQNYGGMSGGADKVFYDVCKEIGLNIKSVHLLKMPENFTLTLSTPKFYTNGVLKKANQRMEKIITDIKCENYRIPKNKKTHEDTWKKNMSNWHLIGEDFHANEKCIKCGKCIEICPAKNISFENGQITFSDKCVACLGCYHRCPAKAIVYKNKKKKDRYTNPNINEYNIGKDIK
ncbi:MAG: EFR1 family ferrodoxin, partial [Clostridia bacterium]|nr:EFR1 family ferrodoxin [Clostridia bacterium]